MRDFQVTNSKVIDHVWYSDETKILSVKFIDGNKEYYKKTGRVRKDLNPKRYLYVGVTTNVFNRFKKAKSKGKFFAKNIRNNYPSQKDVFTSVV